MSLAQPEGYLATPPSGNGPGVLVLHAWWGLNDTIKAFCTRLAESGFVAFAPDLYHGQIADTIPDAEALASALGANAGQAKAEIAAAAEFLSERVGQADRSLAVIGFSLGAYYALDLSTTAPEDIHSVVLFYGTGPADFGKSRASYLGHFAENDEFEPLSGVDELEAALRRAGRPVAFHRYPGARHWFFEPDRPDAYDPAAARLAWERTLAFLMRFSLLHGLPEEYRQWQALLDQIGPGRMEQPGVAGHWSVKDVVAHLTAWRRRTVNRLRAAARGEPEPPPFWPAHLGTDDEVNEWIYESTRGQSLREVLDQSDQVYRQVVAAVEALPDEVLADVPRHLPWLGGAPLSAAVLFGHYHDEHEAGLREWLARAEKG